MKKCILLLFVVLATTMGEGTFEEQSTDYSIFEDEMVVRDDGDDFVQDIVGATLADPASPQYMLVNTVYDDWSSAELSCKSMGMHLATIDSLKQHNHLLEMMKEKKVDKAWIGLSDIKKEGDWKWLNGASKFTKWGSYGPEPNGGRDENCVVLRTYDRGWADYNCDKKLNYICELPREYACYDYDADDRKAMGTNPSVAKQKWRCENDLGYLFTKGDNQKAPGCGSCWCCRPTGHCDRIADIGLLVDYSLSVRYNTAEEKEFVKRLVAKFNLGRERTRASVITFSTDSEMKIKLNQFYDKASFDKAVDNMDMTKHDTRMDLALHKARSEMFQSSNGARVRVPKTLILLTDGIQDPPAQYNEEPRIPAETLRKDGITILAVGVGSTNQQKLGEITGNPNNVYHISNFQQLISKEFIDKIGTKTCESGPKYTCYHWTSADKSRMGPQPWSTGTMKRHCEKTLGHTFTGGNDLKAPGCGGCLCCKALGPWTCHHWTSEDIAKIGPAWNLAAQKRRCEKDLGFKYTAGDNNKAPGCGTCWCCKKNEYKCYHWTSTEKAEIESMHGKWSEANQKGQCEKHSGFKFTKGNEKKAPGCGNCWCCQPIVA